MRRSCGSVSGSSDHHQHPAGDAVGGEDPEDAAPVGERQHRAAECGRQDRCRAHHQRQPRQQHRRRMALGEITHHRARDHHAGRCADRGERSKGRKPLDRRCERAAQAGERIDGGGHDQRPFAAEPVGQRALGHLPDRQSREPGGECQLRRAGGRAERGLDRGECGQVHVGGRRPDRGEETEQDGKPGGVAHAAFIAGCVPDDQRRMNDL